MPTIDMTGIRSFLKAERDLIKTINCNRLHGYVSLGDFVLQHGREWIPAPLPRTIRRERLGECFRNAALLALERPGLTYCEGYAISIIPCMHAWCVTPQGVVVDNTWPDGVEYFGIAIKTNWLQKTLARQKTYGVIDRWEEHWPMLALAPKHWKHTINTQQLSETK